MAVAPIGQTEQAAFRKIWVVGLVWFLVFFRPPPPKRYGLIWARRNLENLAKED